MSHGDCSGGWHGFERWRGRGRHDPFELFFFGPRGGGMGLRFGKRMRRGDIRYAILEVLADRPRHGYDVIRALEERDNGAYRPSPGSVYPTLQMLEDGGFVASEQVAGKRVYTITDEGRTELAKRPGVARDDEDESEGLEGMQAAGRVAQQMRALTEAVHHALGANRGAVGEIVRTIAKARKEIYELLGEDDED